MVSVGSFPSRPSAEVAASMLDAYGIPARVLGDDAGGVAPHINLAASSGYRLDVAEADRAAALELLAEPEPDLVGDRPRGRAAVWRVLIAATVVGFVIAAAVPALT